MIWVIGIIAFLVVVGCYKAGIDHTGMSQVVLGLIVLPFLPVIVVGMIGFYALKLVGCVLFCRW